MCQQACRLRDTKVVICRSLFDVQSQYVWEPFRDRACVPACLHQEVLYSRPPRNLFLAKHEADADILASAPVDCWLEASLHPLGPVYTAPPFAKRR